MLVVRRVLTMLVQMLVAAAALFFGLRFTQGDPVETLAGSQRLTPEAIELLREKYGLNDPPLVQFLDWLVSIFRGDFGESVLSRQPVADLIWPRLVPTVQLAMLAFVLVLIFGLLIGIVSAIRQRTRLDSFLSILTLAGTGIAPYISALLLLTIFAAGLGWFPLFGAGTQGVDRLYHLILPATALAISITALVARTSRVSFSKALNLEFVQMLRTWGYGPFRILFGHVFRNAIIPVLTVSGMAVGLLVAGTIYVENTFGIAGLGTLLVSSVHSRDYAVVQIVGLILVAIYVVANAIVDLLYPVIDPRTRAKGSAS